MLSQCGIYPPGPSNTADRGPNESWNENYSNGSQLDAEKQEWKYDQKPPKPTRSRVSFGSDQYEETRHRRAKKADIA